MGSFARWFTYMAIAVVSFIGFLLVKGPLFAGFDRFEDTRNPYDITVVTLYATLGKFQKGGPGSYFTTNTYRDFMKTWAWLTNKVVAYFDNDHDLEYFRKIRSSQPADRTVLIKVTRSQLDAFKDYERIKDLYSRPDYPKYQPNTVNANYSCTMNAKYDVLQLAMDTGHVSTEFLAWLDIGTFRNLLQLNPQKKTFTLEVPEGFNKSRVGFTEVTQHASLSAKSPWDYIKNNRVWVAGSFMLGSQSVVKKFIRSYKKTVKSLLVNNMSSTDQQVIGAMYSPQFRQEQEVDIATYSCGAGDYGLYGSDIAYFCLAYKTKATSEIRRNNTIIRGQ